MKPMDIHGIDYLGLERVLKRGSGETIGQEDGALLVRDSISGAYLLACEDAEAGRRLLEKHIGPEWSLLMVSDAALGREVYDRYGFSGKLECYQAAYYGEKPPADGRITVRTAGEEDLPMLTETYHLISPEELEQVVRRKKLLIGYHGDQAVGFIGEHLEGSMGILYILPEFRHRGFGAALQAHFIARTMEEGYVPFGQVEKENHASLCLQEKLGMTVSENLIIWMWR